MAKVTRRAFPDAETFPTNSGMTLREWYAGMAFLTIPRDVRIPPGQMMERCFAIADAMMREVEKREENQDG